MSANSAPKLNKPILNSRLGVAAAACIVAPPIAGLILAIERMILNVVFYPEKISAHEFLSGIMFFSHSIYRLDVFTFIIIVGTMTLYSCRKLKEIPLKNVFISVSIVLFISFLNFMQNETINRTEKIWIFIMIFCIPALSSAIIYWAITKRFHSPKTNP